MAASSAVPPPRKRNLTNLQRKQICEEKLRSPQITQSQLAKWAQTTFGLAHQPTQATISNILARKTHYLETTDSDLNIKRRRTVFSQALDDALLNYIRRRHDRGRSLPSASRLKEKGRHYAKKLEIEPSKVPDFSNGWVASFQRRNRLDKKYARYSKRSGHHEEKKKKRSRSSSKSKSELKRHCPPDRIRHQPTTLLNHEFLPLEIMPIPAPHGHLGYHI